MNANASNEKRKKSGNNEANGYESYGKIPPQAIELEEAILGAVMMQKDAFDIAVELLNANCFYADKHQKIYQSFINLKKKGYEIDLLTVVEELKSIGHLDIVGGPFAVVQLTNSIGSSAHLAVHCEIVLKKYLQREIIKVGLEMIHDAYEDSSDGQDILEMYLNKLFDLSKGIYKTDFVSSLDNAAQVSKELDKRLNREPGTITGGTSGFKHVDRVTHGWQNTDLIILAARPAVGKTALALNLAYNFTSKVKKPVAFFSLEMGSGQLVNRIISAISEIPLEKITTGDLNVIEQKQVREAITTFSNVPFFIDDTAGINTIQMKSKLRRLISQHGAGMAIIDYLQLMQCVEGSQHKNRNDQVGEISRDLKIMAKDFNIPIIALSQLTRGVETRAGDSKTPLLSDLRDSGAIEQDADLVVFLYIEGGVTKLRIAKHRNGSLETISIERNMTIQKFSDKEIEPFRPATKLSIEQKTGGNFDDFIPAVEDQYSFR